MVHGCHGIIEDCWSDPGDFVAFRPLHGILLGSWLRRCANSGDQAANECWGAASTANLEAEVCVIP